MRGARPQVQITSDRALGVLPRCAAAGTVISREHPRSAPRCRYNHPGRPAAGVRRPPPARVSVLFSICARPGARHGPPPPQEWGRAPGLRACSEPRSASRVQTSPLSPSEAAGRSRHRTSCIGSAGPCHRPPPAARPCHHPPPAARGATIAPPSVKVAKGLGGLEKRASQGAPARRGAQQRRPPGCHTPARSLHDPAGPPVFWAWRVAVSEHALERCPPAVSSTGGPTGSRSGSADQPELMI